MTNRITIVEIEEYAFKSSFCNISREEVVQLELSTNQWNLNGMRMRRFCVRGMACLNCQGLEWGN